MKLIPAKDFPAHFLSQSVDQDGVFRLLRDLATRKSKMFCDVAVHIAKTEYPLLAGQDVQYIEIFEADLVASTLSEWDREVVRKAVFNGPCCSLALMPPLL